MDHKIYKAGDRVHVRSTNDVGSFDYEARVIYRNDSVIGPACPYYLVAGCSYLLPHTAISDTLEVAA